MKRTIIKGPGFYAVTEDNILVEYLKPDPDNQSGDILLGTVGRIMSGQECAFVDIGRKHAGFLPLTENSLSFSGQTLRSGMQIVVQIRKEERDGKGAYLTRDISLAGKTVLLMPYNRYIGVSSRVSDDESRMKLRKQGGSVADGRTGIVMRQAALYAGTESVEAEYLLLLETWNKVEEMIRRGGPDGTVVYHADPVRQMISDYEGKGPLEIIETEIMNSDLAAQLSRSDERKIRTRNGGNIVIDRCEAMTVIDVNSGSVSANGNSGSVFLETNLAACETIAEQVRLRDLSGIILIDFIDMDRDEYRQAVAQKLAEMFSRDRRKTVMHGWTKLGLMEMTRKRTGR